MPIFPEDKRQTIHLSYHRGQEIDCIVSGHMRFAYEGHVEELGPGDVLKCTIRAAGMARSPQAASLRVPLRDRFEAAGCRDYVGAPGFALVAPFGSYDFGRR